ncbi:MAG TPA: HAD family phosphatase [Gemmataceae bacterium]|jgi:putative hydrolase of the HAD superfamily|nr:HAD family phosphatase [Gemmataceae bacterium]
MIRTIFFDFGKVLALFDHELAVTRLLAHCDLSPDELHDALYETERFHALESGLLDRAEYLRQVRTCAPLRCGDEVFFTTFADIFTPIEEMCALVPTLAKRYRLVLASNTNEIHAGKFLLDYQPTFAHFQHLVLSHEARARKPWPDFYAHCQLFAHCAPHECLFIDDRDDNVAAATEHGWNAISFQGLERLLPELKRLGVYND